VTSLQAMPSGGHVDVAPVDRLGAPMAAGKVRAAPLAEAHRAGLKAACAEDLEIWPIYAWSWDPEHFDATFDRVMARADWRRFALYSEGRLVGISCFIGIDEQRGVLEIGNTYYVPDMRGTGFNRTVKDMMIGRAFDCGFRRIEFRVDARNARSLAAMVKLGAVREGVIRADRVTWTGHVRDTVLFSILADEWRPAQGG
jgi:RimJ/RimL family protein N-acetyltransferase